MKSTIEEKARKEYPYITPSDGYECHAYNEAAKDGFIAGANWMLEKAADWKDKQFKEYLEQKKLEYEIERGTLRFGGDVIEKIIKELFGGGGRNRYEQII